MAKYRAVYSTGKVACIVECGDEIEEIISEIDKKCNTSFLKNLHELIKAEWRETEDVCDIYAVLPNCKVKLLEVGKI